MTPPAAAGTRHEAVQTVQAVQTVASAAPAPSGGPVPVEPAAQSDVTCAAEADAPLSLVSLQAGDWCHLLERLGLAGIIYNVASNCELRAIAQGHFDFLLDAENASLYNESHDEKLRLALQNYFSAQVQITITQGAPQGETPAMRATRLADERQQQAVSAIENDPQLQALITRFDGELDRASILPTDARKS